jgi:hypothetical protein
MYFKTYKEALEKLGVGTMVYCMPPNEPENAYVVILGLDSFDWYYLSNINISITTCTVSLDYCAHQIVDWFEESQSASKDCTCELLQILQVGCRCGSIIPYDNRK